MEYNLMFDHLFEIEDDSGEFVRLGEGIANADPQFNEELAQDRYLNNAGFGSTDVIGSQLTLAFSGHRAYGDPAQDFIFGKVLGLGPTRKTNFRWTEPDGGIFEGSVTIANITGPSGDAGAKGDISFEIHFNGKPEYTPPTEVEG